MIKFIDAYKITRILICHSIQNMINDIVVLFEASSSSWFTIKYNSAAYHISLRQDVDNSFSMIHQQVVI